MDLGQIDAEGFTAAMCIFDPMSIAAAPTLTGLSSGQSPAVLFLSTAILPSMMSRRVWAMPIVIFLIAPGRRHHSQVRMHPWTTFFNGNCASNNRPAATLPAIEDNTRLFLRRTGAPRCWTVF